MKSFVVKKGNKKIKLEGSLPKMEGFKYHPKLANNSLEIKEIIIIKEELIDSLITASFNKKYKEILEFYLKILSDNNEDSANGKLMRALDEIARLRNILIKKYQKVLSKKCCEKLLKKLKILENEIRIKVIDYKMILEQQKVPEVEKGKSR